MNTINIKALSEQVSKLSASGGSGLPDVTAADNGKVLGVVEGSWSKMDAPSGGVNYSTTEQNTGRKWIDGKDIYQLTIDCGESGLTIPNGTSWSADLSLGFTVDKIVGIEDMISLTDEYIFRPKSYLKTSKDAMEFQTTLATDVTVRYITILYTKPASALTKATKKKTTK